MRILEHTLPEIDSFFTKQIRLSQTCFFHSRWSCKMIGGS